MTWRSDIETDDYCCLACNDGKWNVHDMDVDVDYDEYISPYADIGTIVINSKPRCLADYIKRIQNRSDSLAYELDQEKRLRHQAESRADRLLWSLEETDLHLEVFRRLWIEDPNMDNETKDYEFNEMLKIVEAERNA